MRVPDKGDPADSNAASYTPDMAAELDTLEDQWLEATRDLDKHAAVSWCAKQSNKQPVCDLSHFVAIILADPNPALNLWAFAFAFGMEVTLGTSQNQKAKELKITRAALSKRVVQLSIRYGLRSRNMKSVAAREAYRKDRSTNHHRYQKQIENAKNEIQELHQELLD